MDFSTLSENLKKKGYVVYSFATAKEAADFLDREIDGVSVGYGGSMTLTEMGITERLASHNRIVSHWAPPTGMTVAEARLAAMTTDAYLLSANGIAESGEIVNIDGTCNRIAGSVFGHTTVYFVIGENKVAKTLDAAIDRARNVAAPKNAQRLERKTPCAVKADRCYDCDSPDRICRGMTVLLKAPSAQKSVVILISESLGY